MDCIMSLYNICGTPIEFRVTYWSPKYHLYSYKFNDESEWIISFSHLYSASTYHFFLSCPCVLGWHPMDIVRSLMMSTQIFAERNIPQRGE